MATILGAGRGWAELRALGYRFMVGPNDISLLIAGARASAAERQAESQIASAEAALRKEIAELESLTRQ